jgi:hypothetical protein
MSIALKMETVLISETSIYETARRHIPEGSHFHCRRREKLKSHTGYTPVYDSSVKLFFNSQMQRASRYQTDC